ncbi:MAG: sugar phosphate nucleotidyltransferase [Desulfobacteraceae bacterium]|nr:sugar phosphate nucleotidyltransferase [Desulfobacteraceae bacterium]
MKALILAAGLGTRLLPFTRHTPKPLFTLNQRPMLDLIVERLVAAGCQAAIINTHHHHEQIETFIAQRRYPIPVLCRHEPEILGTGGAIRNVADFWSGQSALIINSDIVTDIDLRSVFAFHGRHQFPVTMVMHDYLEFNSVQVDDADFIVDFEPKHPVAPHDRILAFTGIHVVDARVLDFLPPEGPAHVISAYGRMLKAGERIKALVARNHRWRDIGTPESYKIAARDHMAPIALEGATGQKPDAQIQYHSLSGDGSDRRWYRVTHQDHSIIMVDHGIRPERHGRQEVDAYVDIGLHLYSKSVPVPQVHLFDRFSGLVFLQDLGDQHLQTAIQGQSQIRIKDIYGQVLSQWLHMAIAGAEGFDPNWTYQTARYDRELILSRECRYFMEAFVHGYVGRSDPYEIMEDEFQCLADRALQDSVTGFMHRDLQSRNIMVQNERIFFIDFQGGRMGPLQYDLASLLIDPYAALSPELQRELARNTADQLARRTNINPDQFLRGYEYCALTRNLQMLGAFGFLSRVKGKTFFEGFIPMAIRTLQRNLQAHGTFFPKLTALVDNIAKGIGI